MHNLLRVPAWKQYQASYPQMNVALGEGTVSYSTVARWFRRFASGDTSLKDDERLGRPVELQDRDMIRELQVRPDATTRELAQSLGFAHATIENRLTRLECFWPSLEE